MILLDDEDWRQMSLIQGHLSLDSLIVKIIATTRHDNVMKKTRFPKTRLVADGYNQGNATFVIEEGS